MDKSGLLLLVVLCSNASWLTTAQLQPAAVSQYATKTLAYLNAVKLAGPDDLLAQGWKGDGSGRNWRRLAAKLATRGATINMVAFGGSVTAGYYQRTRNSSWVYEVQDWLQVAFPNVKFTLLNLARASADVAAAAACWYRYIPPSTDLVFIEYSVNGCGDLQCLSMKSPLVADYETLIRRVIRKAPKAAIMAFAIFPFIPYKPTPDDARTEVFVNPYYNTGEDMHSILAKRYSIPMVSTRDALYDIMFDDAAAKAQLGYTRKDLMLDFIHPAWLGHFVYGRGLVAYGVRQMLRQELGALINGATLEAPKPLPRVVSPLAAQQADGDTWCAEGVFFRDHVVALSQGPGTTPTFNLTSNSTSNVTNNSTLGFNQSSANVGGTPGSTSNSTAAGDTGVTSSSDPSSSDPSSSGPSSSDPSGSDPSSSDSGVTTAGYTTIGSDVHQVTPSTDWAWTDDLTYQAVNACPTFNCKKFGYTATGAGKYLEVALSTARTARMADRQLNKQLLVIMFNKQPLKRKGMGRALASCIAGCKCQDFVLDGANTDKSSQLGLAGIEVSKNLQCRVRITILPSDGFRGEEFKVTGIALVPYTDLPPLTNLDYRYLGDNITTPFNPADNDRGILDMPWTDGNVPDDSSLLELGV